MSNAAHLPSDDLPWYRLFWPWFLLAVPFAAVVMGLGTLVIALSTADGLVIDDYYKQGLAINRTLARDHKAMELQLGALVRIDPQTGKVQLQLETSEKIAKPKFLYLQLLHPTRSHFDSRIMLQTDGNSGYSGMLQPTSNGNWYLLIEPNSREWRLTGRIKLPKQTSVWLGKTPFSSSHSE
jgi:hypothetical protein